MGEERIYHWGAEPTPNQRRVTASEAAQALGISEGAVRMRVKRGTLPSTREGRRRYVLLTPDPTTDPTTEPTQTRTDELIAELRDRVRSLEDQMHEEREANRENRRIIAALTSRIPEIEAPADTSSEQRESPTGATEQPGRVEPQRSVEAADAAERAGREPSESARGGGRLHRAWWRRMFGG